MAGGVKVCVCRGGSSWHLCVSISLSVYVCEWAGWCSMGMTPGCKCDPSIWELVEAGFRSGVEEMNQDIPGGSQGKLAGRTWG